MSSRFHRARRWFFMLTAARWEATYLRHSVANASLAPVTQIRPTEAFKCAHSAGLAKQLTEAPVASFAQVAAACATATTAAV